MPPKDEMARALEADGEKLRQLTGEDHGPWRVVLCEACGSEGRLYVTDYDSSQGCWGERDIGPCPYFEGTGGEIIAVQPIDMEDLDQC